MVIYSSPHENEERILDFSQWMSGSATTDNSITGLDNDNHTSAQQGIYSMHLWESTFEELKKFKVAPPLRISKISPVSITHSCQFPSGIMSQTFQILISHLNAPYFREFRKAILRLCYTIPKNIREFPFLIQVTWFRNIDDGQHITLPLLSYFTTQTKKTPAAGIRRRGQGSNSCYEVYNNWFIMPGVLHLVKQFFRKIPAQWLLHMKFH